MVPVSHAYKGSTCELKDVDNNSLAAGTISNITTDYVEIRFDEEITVLPPNTLIKVNIFNDKLGYKVIIGKAYLGNVNFIRIIEIMSLADFEKRDFFRITIGEKTSFYRDEITSQEIHYTKQKPCPVYMNNISLCGAYFTTTEILYIGETVFLVIALARGAEIFPCIVRRTCQEEKKGDTKIYGYGCEFLNHTQRQSDSLYKYIFDKQLAFLKRTQKSGVT